MFNPEMGSQEPEEEIPQEEIESVDEEQPEREEVKEKEQTSEEILDALESAFEKGVKAELTVSEPSGGLRTSSVFIEGLEGGMLFVSSSKESPIIGIPIGDIKKAELIEKETEE